MGRAQLQPSISMALQFPSVTEWSQGLRPQSQFSSSKWGGGLTHWKGQGHGGRQTGSIPPLLFPWLPLGPFWPCSGKFLTCGDIMRQPRAPYGKGTGQRDLLMGEERRAPAQLSPSSLPRAVRGQGAEEKGPFPAQISPSPKGEQHMQSCFHYVHYNVTTSRGQLLKPLCQGPQKRGVIYKEVTPRHLAILIPQLLVRQEDRSPLGRAGVRKSGILWPLKGAHSACFSPLPGLLLCICSNESFH